MGIRKNTKEYDKICLCWSFYQYMCDNLVEENTIEGFLIAYNLTSEEALIIGRENGFEINKKHLKNIAPKNENKGAAQLNSTTYYDVLPEGSHFVVVCKELDEVQDAGTYRHCVKECNKLNKRREKIHRAMIKADDLERAKNRIGEKY